MAEVIVLVFYRPRRRQYAPASYTASHVDRLGFIIVRGFRLCTECEVVATLDRHCYPTIDRMSRHQTAYRDNEKMRQGGVTAQTKAV